MIYKLTAALLLLSSQSFGQCRGYTYDQDSVKLVKPVLVHQKLGQAIKAHASIQDGKATIYLMMVSKRDAPFGGKAIFATKTDTFPITFEKPTGVMPYMKGFLWNIKADLTPEQFTMLQTSIVRSTTFPDKKFIWGGKVGRFKVALRCLTE